jgi:hypothetical protein
MLLPLSSIGPEGQNEDPIAGCRRGDEEMRLDLPCVANIDTELVSN